MNHSNFNARFTKAFLPFLHSKLFLKNDRFAKKGNNAKTLKKEVAGSNVFPLNSLIYSDQSHAVYEDLGGFRAINSEEGLSLDCLKLALKVIYQNLLRYPAQACAKRIKASIWILRFKYSDFR